MSIEIRHLRYFIAVADELHFGCAAARLHISQPPLSRQIQSLEQDLGLELFHRTGRSVELTDAGHAFRRDAERLLASLEHAKRNAREVARGARGHLRVGFVSTVLYNVLPQLIRDFRSAYPDVEVELKEMTADAQLSAFAEDALDIGFMIAPEPADGIELTTIHREPLILCLPSDHKLARKRAREPIDVALLRGEPFVMFPRHLSPGLYDQIVGYTERAGFALKQAQLAVQMQTIVGLASAGVGLAIVPECMRGLERPGVVYRALSPRAPVVETVFAASRSGRSTVTQAFADVVVSH